MDGAIHITHHMTIKDTILLQKESIILRKLSLEASNYFISKADLVGVHGRLQLLLLCHLVYQDPTDIR